MSDVKHTAGIWQFSKRGQRVYGGALRDVQVAQVRLDSAEWEANGLLIAAAPDLLAALKASNEKLQSLLFDGEEHPLVAAANAAIAKASGETP